MDGFPQALAVRPASARRARAAVVRELGPGPSPEAVFRVLTRRRGVFFLDSAGGPGHLARWSFLGAGPFTVLEATERRVVESGHGGLREGQANPFAALGEALERLCLPRAESPVPFAAGGVGFLGYDLRHAVERIPRRARRDQSFPDMRVAFYDRLLAHDARSGSWYATSAAIGPGEALGPERAIEGLRRVLDEAGGREPGADVPPAPLASGQLSSNMTRERYLRSVERMLDYIAAGDIFQANFTRRFETSCRGRPEDLYLALRRRNPAPFAAYLDCGEGRAVLGSSPERFLRIRGREVATRPIKGTRPRGRDAGEDLARSGELLASAKDAAELAMIVDLERNDLGRVCDYGSVHVAEAKALEAYPTVFHLVATVTGGLAEGRAVADLLKATFPGGSITGAPKVRAMEIIDELEPTARSVYTGAAGWFDLSGDLDLNIVIRTMLWDAGRVTYQVGGGIVADSDPEAEYEETLAKGRALAEALSRGETHGS
jgi:para-aminobenzoate synthetase component 1